MAPPFRAEADFVTWLLLAIAGVLAGPAPPRPSRGRRSPAFNVTPSTTQAGGHPDLTIQLRVENRETQHIPAPTCDCQDAKDIDIHLPAGFIGDPHSTPQCSAVNFARETCPADSQVGIVELGLGSEESQPDNPNEAGRIPGWLPRTAGRLQPCSARQPARASRVQCSDPLQFPIYTVLEPRTEGDYGLDAKVININHIFPLHTLVETLWGVPASPVHNELRHPPGATRRHSQIRPATPACRRTTKKRPSSTTRPPAACPSPRSTDVTSYDREVTHAELPIPRRPAATSSASTPASTPSRRRPRPTPPRASTSISRSPSSSSPTVPSPSEIRATTVTLPAGFSINPNAADGKTSCTDAEAQLRHREEAALPGRLEGRHPRDRTARRCPGRSRATSTWANRSPANATGCPRRQRLRRPHQARRLGPRRHPDGPADVTFPNFPQTPLLGLQHALLRLRTGTAGDADPVRDLSGHQHLHALGLSCSGRRPPTQFFSLDTGPAAAPAPAPRVHFNPSLRSGSRRTRPPAPTRPSRSTLDPPRRRPEPQPASTSRLRPGFSATLAGVPYCPDAALAAPPNPVYSGLAELANAELPRAPPRSAPRSPAPAPATHPVYLPGKVYLAGPYKGAPLSLAVITPAVSGPTTSATSWSAPRSTSTPTTAQITAVSDPLPQILEGIPLRLRSILVEPQPPRISRSTRPTANRPRSAPRSTATRAPQCSAPIAFQVANCVRLPFAPEARPASCSGGTKRAKNPALTATLTAQPGDANIAATIVTLPPASFLDNAHIKTVCTRVQFAADDCPPAR